MKGFGSSILAFIFLIAIAVTAFYTYGLAVGVNEGVVKKISIEKDVYLLGNAAEYGKLYLDAALKYSVYQALYDYGLEQKAAAFWEPVEIESGAPYSGSMFSYINLYSESQFFSTLSRKIKENMDKYTENKITYFNTDYKVNLPKYEISMESPISIKAKPDSKAEIRKQTVTEDIIIRKSAELSFTPTYSLFEEATTFVSSRKAENSVNNILSSFDLVGKKNSECQVEPIEVFNVVHNSSFPSFVEAGEKISSMVFSEMSGIVSDANSTSTWSVLPSGNVTITTECIDSCVEPKSTSCTFEYVHDFEFIFSIEGNESFPVVSGDIAKKTRFEPQKLEFRQRITNSGI